MINNRKARRDAAKGKGANTPAVATMREITPEERAKRNRKNAVAKQSRKNNRGR